MALQIVHRVLAGKRKNLQVLHDGELRRGDLRHGFRRRRRLLSVNVWRQGKRRKIRTAGSHIPEPRFTVNSMLAGS